MKLALWALLLDAALAFASSPRSPENQVFQWVAEETSEDWPDGSRKEAAAYLWIPENCARLRGLLIFGANVPEHMLVGHEAIRETCRRNDLGIVWAVPSFWHFSDAAKGHDSRQVEFLEELLRQLAAVSGYEEVATAPWLPIGESGHLLMVEGLIKERPEKVIAGICVKNPGPRSTEVPVLWTLGTGQEWKQAQVTVTDNWANTGNYAGWCQERAARSEPLSMAIEPGTGHFYCSEEMTLLFASYIDAAARARLTDNPGDPLRAVDLGDGVLAALPLAGQTELDILSYRQALPDQLARPWFFNAEVARKAQALAAVNWEAAPQFVAFSAGPGCRVTPYSLNSVTEIFVEGDGDFSVGAALLREVPGNFPDAGARLEQAAGRPIVEWICGPFAPAGEGRFRIALDRTSIGRAAAYAIARHDGDEVLRRTVQPARVTFVPNTKGASQSIDFVPIADIKNDATSVPLRAVADSGLPVSFFVEHGPAIVKGDTLEILPLPPRTRYPVTVAVTAWQWGRRSEPAVQAATSVTRTFLIHSP